MSVWREVQEALYQRWAEGWADTTPFVFDDEKFDPPKAPWVRFSVKRMPGGAGTLGRKGNRKMDRRGRLFIQLFVPPGDGVGDLSDLAEAAAALFENCRFEPHDIRFGQVEPGESGDSDKGRWTSVTIDDPFDYEDIR